jgi:dihydroxy-acid dehydratase
MPNSDRSCHITEGIARSPNRAMFYGLGYNADDFDKPMIGINNGHSTITPCNAGLQKLLNAAATAIQSEGANPQIFGVPTISDGMAMGTEGMKYSLVSREVIATASSCQYKASGWTAYSLSVGATKTLPAD